MKILKKQTKHVFKYKEKLSFLFRMVLVCSVPFLLSCCLYCFGIDIRFHPITQTATYLLFIWCITNELECFGLY